MGNYTRVIDLNGDVVQAYMCGNDDYATFKVGDKVPFQIDEDHPGRANYPDGAHDALYEKSEDPDSALVVVKDHTIWCVIRVTHREYSDPSFVPLCVHVERVEQIFQIKPLARELWPKEQWAELKRYERVLAAKRKPYHGSALLRPLAEPIYDDEPNKDFLKHYERMRQLRRKK